MNIANERHLFPGGNTSKGFYSFYRYILSQKNSNRLICLKGGPGTGKSSLMKKLGLYFSNLGYLIEYHHCSSDNNSLDGLVIPKLKVALLDGTSPHIVDPVNPGAVDEILNLGVALDTNALSKSKKEIITINEDIGKSFKRAYRFLGAAKSIHEDWSNMNHESINPYYLNTLIKELKERILTIDRGFRGLDRHLFGTAFTPDGIISYNKSLSSSCDNLYILKGGPGLCKTDVLKALGAEALKFGYFVEYLHDPFIPERIENILIPELSTGIFTTNEISNITYSGTVYNMRDLCYKSSLNAKLDELLYDKNQFNTLVQKSISCIKNSKALHDELETYYIEAMDFNIVNSLYNDTLDKIKQYI